MTAHWGMPDPAEVEGTTAEVGFAFADTYRMLYNRISAFANLKMTGLDVSSFKTVEDIAKQHDAIYHNPTAPAQRVGADSQQRRRAPHRRISQDPDQPRGVGESVVRCDDAAALLREKGTPFSELGLHDPGKSDDELLMR